MRLHLLSLPHTQTTSEYLSCAYTQKVVKFCRMMHEDHEVFLYSGEENEAPCTEHIPIYSEAKRAKWFGKGFDTVLTPLEWNPRVDYWREFNKGCAREVLKRGEPTDLLLILGGDCQAPVVQIVQQSIPMLPIEWGVGYYGIATPHRIFESYAWMHHVYGKQGITNGIWYDSVVPNFFDPEEFHVGEKGDYLLFMGRLVQSKGPSVAVEIAKRLDMKLVMAGPGGKQLDDGTLHAPGMILSYDKMYYVGTVGVEERARLMSGARAILMPTYYLEPFGGVAVEGMLSGTPAITPDWGAFTETVENGVTGHRFNTLDEACDGVKSAMELDPESIRDRALSRYSLDAIKPQFEAHFERILNLWGDGWYA